MQKSRSRPKPVSCHSCRSKKLKCNRECPCSNCRARGITCTFLVAPASLTQADSNVTGYNDLQERIQRLEAVMLTRPSDTRELLHASNEYREGQSELTPASIPFDDPRTHVKEYQVLENVATREDAILPSLSNALEFRIRGTQDILGLQDLSEVKRAHDRRVDESTIVMFPDFPTASELFRSYESNVDHGCRILHIPTVRASMKAFYLRLGQREPVLPGQAALLLSIFAIASFFFQPSASSEVAATNQDVVRLARAFSKSALDVLDYSRRNTSCTLEDVQAHILMSLLTFQLDGFSARGRILSSTALSVARDLRLHQLDAGSRPFGKEACSARTLVELEVKRRVFWYLTSTDWLLSAVSGPQEGTYLIQPNHIQVHLPRDCTDDELLLLDGDGSGMGPQPTGITYLLQRVKLAHLCREMVDSIPLGITNAPKVSYEKIVALDKRLVEFISALPFFFRMDPESRARTTPLETLHPALPILRYSINQAAYSRRCRLHQNFLFRQSADPRYSYSRQACLESARAVIQSDQDLICPDPPWIGSARRGIATYFKHLATVVLVMDLCFNPHQPDTAEIKADVKGILDGFEVARHLSPLLTRFLNSLHDILRKHNVDLESLPGTETDQSQGVTDQLPRFGSFVSGDNQEAIYSSMDQGIAPDLDAFMNESWLSGFENEQQIDLSAWDSMFSTLDSRSI